MSFKRLLCLIVILCLLFTLPLPASARVGRGGFLRANENLTVNVSTAAPESVPVVPEPVSFQEKSVEKDEKPQEVPATSTPEPVSSKDGSTEDNEKSQEIPAAAAPEPAPSEMESASDAEKAVVTPVPASQPTPAAPEAEAAEYETDFIPVASEAATAEERPAPEDKTGQPTAAPDDSQVQDSEIAPSRRRRKNGKLNPTRHRERDTSLTNF